MHRVPPGTAFAIILMSAVLALVASAPAAPAAQRIGFDDLRRIHASTGDADEAAAPAVELTGFMLPADLEGGLVYEFMLYPQPGSCSHLAPPPASQVVRVIPDEPFEAERVYQPVRVTGTLTSEHNKAQLYVLDGVLVVESGFRISAAAVEGVEVVPTARPFGSKSPWRFLDR